MADVQTGHPSPERLAAFRLGRLPPAERAATEAHLARCDACRHQLDNLPDATVLSVMRRSAEATEAQGRPAPRPAGPRPTAVPTELANHPRYRVLQLLGRGGMGAVYKAEHRLMQRLVALKVIDPNLTADPAAVERFRREVIAAARLTHPNIVTALDAEQVGSLHFLVMEYVEGTSLAALVGRGRALPVLPACNYVAQAAAGLQHAHRCGMVHRDIKPHNLMLTPQGRVKVLDFGLARFVSESASHGGLTQQGTLMGTPDYIAPEQIDDASRADIRADVYSLGCTLYCLLTGRPPFPGGTMMQKVRAHFDREPAPLRSLRPDVPPALEEVVARMMAKQPGQRYQTPAEVIQALAPFHGAGGSGTTAAAAPARPPEAIPLTPAAVAVPARPAPASPSVTAAPDWSSLTDDAPPPAAAELPARKVLPLVLGAVALVLVAVGLAAVVAVRGLTETRPTQAEAEPPPRSTAPARSPQAAWPLELVQQGKIPAPDMSGRPILFNDTFSNPNSGFPVRGDEYSENAYRGGKYHLRTKSGPGAWWVWDIPGNNRYVQFACQITGRSLGPRSEGWGCVVRGPTNQAVRVSIDSEGALRLQAFSAAVNPWASLANPVNKTFLHPAIKPHGEANRLLCLLRGRQLELYVNGVAVHKPIVVDLEVAPTTIAFCILGGPNGSEAELEQITVWSVEDLSPPEARGVPAK
jgi:serine/threonine protein kinase